MIIPALALLMLLPPSELKAFDLKSFEQELRSNDAPMGRQIAISALESMKPPPVETVPLVADFLARDPSDLVRTQAARTLGALISGIPSIELGLRKEDVHKPTDPLPKLSSREQQGVAALVQSLKTDPNRGVRMEAIDALMRIRPPTEAVLPTYLHHLENNDFFRLRRMAADAIRLYGQSAASAESTVRSVLAREPDARVRKALLHCLDSFGTLTPETTKSIAVIQRSDLDWGARTAASKILASRGLNSASSEADDALAKYPTSSRELKVLLQVIRSTTPGVNEPFAVEESWWGTRDRARALERLSRPLSSPALKDEYLSLLDDPDASVRVVAAVAQTSLKDNRAINKIRPLLSAEITAAANSKASIMGLSGVYLAQSLMILGDCESVRQIIECDKLMPMLSIVLTSCKSEARPFLLKRAQESGEAGRHAKNLVRTFYGTEALPK